MVDRIEHYAGPDNVACHLDLLLGRGWDVRQHQSGYRYRVIHQSGRILVVVIHHFIICYLDFFM